MKKKAFTLIELLVVISIIALLLAILVPSLKKAKTLAQGVVCKSNLKHWGVCWYMYTDDNGGKFPSGASVNGAAVGDWPVVMWPYYNARGALTLCPSATRTFRQGARDYGHAAWEWDKSTGWYGLVNKNAADYGSYGLNEFINDPPGGVAGYWRTREVPHGRTSWIPLFFDCAWMDTWQTDNAAAPPPYENWLDINSYSNEMSLVCINRHSGFGNYLFLDFNIRPVGLKSLWGLEWTRVWDYRTSPWTKAGGVKPEDWPQWMRKFEQPER